MNSANRKVDQSLSDFQTGLGATAFATLDTEQLISHLHIALVDTLSSLSEAEGDVIPVSEVCELLLPDSWHFGQGCFQASWKFSTYSSTFV